MIFKTRPISWFQILFLGAFYTLALALPISEALKQISAIIIILLGIHLIFESELKIKEDLVTYSAVGIILFSIISAVLALNSPKAIEGLIDIIRILLIFLIIKNIPLNRRQVIRFKKLLFISMLLALCYGGYQLYFDSKTNQLLFNSIRQISQSSFYIVLVFSLALSYFLNNQLHKIFLLVIIFSSLAGLFIMANQTMLVISLLIILLFLIFALQSAAKNSQLLFLFVMILVIPIIILFGNDYRLEKLFLAFSQRNDMLGVTILAWIDYNLFFGIGIDNIQYINPQNYIETESTSIFLNNNTYITYLVERGLVGLGIYLLFLFSVLAALIKKYTKTKDSLVIAAILIWLATFIISGICTTFHDENGLLIALIWGMALNEHLT